LSFNEIRVISNLDNVPDLEVLYLANNKIKKIENLDKLPKLKLLELGSNRITVCNSSVMRFSLLTGH